MYVDFLLVSVVSYQYGPDLVMAYANEAFYALLQEFSVG